MCFITRGRPHTTGLRGGVDLAVWPSEKSIVRVGILHLILCLTVAREHIRLLNWEGQGALAAEGEVCPW